MHPRWDIHFYSVLRGWKEVLWELLVFTKSSKAKTINASNPAVTPLYLQLTIGSRFSLHYRVMEKFGEHEEAYELPEAIA